MPKRMNFPPQKPIPFSEKFAHCKKNTISSLNDVECFLNNFKHFMKYVKLYKILR